MASSSSRCRGTLAATLLVAVSFAGCSGNIQGGGDDADAAPAGAGADGAPAADARSDQGPTIDATPGSPDAAAPTGGCAGASVCEDFEATAVGTLPPAGWSIVTPSCSGTGTLSIATAQAHSGTHALQIDGAGGYCNHIFLATPAPGAGGAALHGRFFVRLDDPLGDGHVTFMALHDSVDAKDLRMGGQSRILMWNRELNDATLPALSPSGIALSVQPAADAWHCVQFDIDGAAGTLRTAVDGVAVAGLVIDATPTADVDQQWLQSGAWHPRLTEVRLGWESYAGQPMRLWFDDVAIGSAPIPCP